jgi:hypothetical protein
MAPTGADRRRPRKQTQTPNSGPETRPRANRARVAIMEAMMTGGDEKVSVKAIELCRNLNRKAAVEYLRRGISLEDVTVAALYSTFDIAQRFKGGNPFEAIEWIRTGADLMERQLMGAANE